MGDPEIVVLEGLEPIRVRPHMYAGDITSPATRTFVLTRLACLAADAAVAGHRVHLDVALEAPDTACVSFDAGIPLALHEGRSCIEVIFTQLYACAGLRKAAWVETWLCAPGVAVTSALSSALDLETHHAGRRYRQRFERGKARPPEIDAGGPDRSWLRVQLDTAIFPDPTFDVADLTRALEDLHMLAPFARVTLAQGGRAVPIADFEAARRAAPEAARRRLDAIATSDLARVPVPEGVALPEGDPLRRLAVALMATLPQDRTAVSRLRGRARALVASLSRGEAAASTLLEG